MIESHRLALSAFAALTLAPFASVAAAQTGPFADGELLVYARDPATDERVLWRIDPVTGQAGDLLRNTYSAPAVGWVAYDPWRDGVLAYISWLPAGERRCPSRRRSAGERRADQAGARAFTPRR